jgi:hypothetical protein
MTVTQQHTQCSGATVHFVNRFGQIALRDLPQTGTAEPAAVGIPSEPHRPTSKPVAQSHRFPSTTLGASGSHAITLPFDWFPLVRFWVNRHAHEERPSPVKVLLRIIRNEVNTITLNPHLITPANESPMDRFPAVVRSIESVNRCLYRR